jgi:hypothetical protein
LEIALEFLPFFYFLTKILLLVNNYDLFSMLKKL